VISPVRWEDGRLVLLDQTKLPTEEVERAYTAWADVAEAIRTLVVRGAPAIGVAAAFGVVLAARASGATTHATLLADLEEAIKGLAATRPTAVNLFWALDRMRRLVVAGADVPPARLRERLLEEAQAILSEDLAANRAMGAHGAALVPDGARLLRRGAATGRAATPILRNPPYARSPHAGAGSQTVNSAPPSAAVPASITPP